MKRTPRGCSNIGGSLAAKIEYCRNKAMQLFSLYGYRPFSPAELQLVGSVWDKLSPSRCERLIALTSPFGEPCVMRADLTLSAVSYLASHFRDEERPLRLSYADRIFALPLPPRQRLEENQVGIELIGWEGEGADVEVVSLLFRVLDELGIDAFVAIGDMSVMSKIFSKLTKETAELLTANLRDGIYTNYTKNVEETDVPEKDKELLRALPTLKGGVEVIDRAMSLSDEPEMFLSLKALCDALTRLGYGEKIRVDLGFMRELGYYSGPIFNAYSSDGALLGGGGRYDGLLAKMGMDGEASGFALDLKEIASYCAGSLLLPKVMIWCGKADTVDCINFAERLRAAKISFELSWQTDKNESVNLARLRKYSKFINLEDLTITDLPTGETKEIDLSDSEELSC